MMCPHAIIYVSSYKKGHVHMLLSICPHVIIHVSSCTKGHVHMSLRICPHVIMHVSSCQYKNMSSCYHACVLMSICMCPHVFHFYVGVGTMVKIPTLPTPARRILWVVLENFHTVTLVCPTIIGWNKLLAREASGYIAPRQQRRSTKRA